MVSLLKLSFYDNRFIKLNRCHDPYTNFIYYPVLLLFLFLFFLIRVVIDNHKKKIEAKNKDNTQVSLLSTRSMNLSQNSRKRSGNSRVSGRMLRRGRVYRTLQRKHSPERPKRGGQL